jgi:hypothetical protein
MRSQIGSWSDRLRSSRIVIGLPSGEADCLRPLPERVEQDSFCLNGAGEGLPSYLAPPWTEQVESSIILRCTADDAAQEGWAPAA